MSEAKLSCFFCDDVRHELGGKFSMMGIYTGSLIFHKYPFTLPSLMVVMRLCYPINEKILSLKFIVTDEGNNEIINEVPDEIIQKTYEDIQSARTKDGKARYQVINTIIKINAIEFTEKTYMRSKAIVNDEEINGEGLIIKSSDD